MKLLICILTVAFSSLQVFAFEAENKQLYNELKAQEASLNNDLAVLSAKGLGTKHPESRALQNRLRVVQAQLKKLDIKTEDTIILLKGDTSNYLAGHPKAGESAKVLPALLKEGWKVQKIISVGNDSAYVWLRK